VEGRVGLDLLCQSPRKEEREELRSHFDGMSGAERQDLVDRLLLRVALFVGDLQASQSHHHSRPYGLLDHLMGVALGTLRRLVLVDLESRERVGPLPQKRMVWIYGGLVLGLLHDLAKVLDLDVWSPEGQDRWNPLAEPLALFLHRNHLSTSGPRFWHYRAGRGVTHELLFPLFASLVLPPEAVAYLGPAFGFLAAAWMSEATGQRPSQVPEIALEIARIVREEDIESAMAK
jgi:hypothetical protein